MEIGLDSRKCPICREIMEKTKVKAELLRKLGAPEEEIAKLERRKYCPFHLKVMKIQMLRKTKAERVFSISEAENSFRVHFGYKNHNDKATLHLIIPKFKGKLTIMANGYLFFVNHEILNLFTTNELQTLNSLINGKNQKAKFTETQQD